MQWTAQVRYWVAFACLSLKFFTPAANADGTITNTAANHQYRCFFKARRKSGPNTVVPFLQPRCNDPICFRRSGQAEEYCTECHGWKKDKCGTVVWYQRKSESFSFCPDAGVWGPSEPALESRASFVFRTRNRTTASSRGPKCGPTTGGRGNDFFRAGNS